MKRSGGVFEKIDGDWVQTVKPPEDNPNLNKKTAKPKSPGKAKKSTGDK